jgi:hypothetical protein
VVNTTTPLPAVTTQPMAMPHPTTFNPIPTGQNNPYGTAAVATPATLASTPPNTNTAGASKAPNATKQMFQNNQAVIYALNVRNFGTVDRNKDGNVSFSMGESGSFIKAANRLPELQKLGVNVVHLLPITRVGQLKKLGNAGSIYAMANPGTMQPDLDEPGNRADVETEARYFVQKAHQLGIKVIVDLPSCVASEVEYSHPELLIRDKNGKPTVPATWVDIMMLKPGGKPIEDFFAPFFDLIVNRLGVDGVRADVARARDLSFWQHYAQQKYPQLAWLAESYGEESAPISNLPRDLPQDLLHNGFDSIYGQLHIFHHWDSANEYQKYLTDTYSMLRRAGSGKSIIGSFLTHDDPSLMPAGGALQYMLSAGLMSTQPWTNPYILDGFTTGYDGELDIFNYAKRPEGQHPEIGEFMQQMLTLRQQPNSPWHNVLTQGWYVPLPVKTGDRKNQVIAFARHLNGKTLLVVANKDVNARHKGTITLPGLPANTLLTPQTDLAKAYGKPSTFAAKAGQVSVDLGPGRFHMFSVNTPNLPDDKHLPAYPGTVKSLVPQAGLVVTPAALAKGSSLQTGEHPFNAFMASTNKTLAMA